MHLSAITIYPVKSLAPVHLEEASIEDRGLKMDRRLMITDSAGMGLTQREFPKMALIRAEVTENGVNLISAEGGAPFEVDLQSANGHSGSDIEVEIWGDRCNALDLGNEAAEWISRALGSECRLTVMPSETRRPVDKMFGDHPVSFADAYPVLAASESSLGELNRRMETPLPMARFRPNLVISGTVPFEEDDWKIVKIGDSLFRSAIPCARCVVTTIDQDKGEKAGKEPLKTLAAFRSAKDAMPERYASLGLSPNDVLFGQTLIPAAAGTVVKVGDKVEVIERY